MRNRKPRVRREQPSLQPLYPPLLHLAEVIENDGGVDMRDAENLIDFSHAVWDQYDAQRNSTAPSTESEELPKMETGKEVAVPSVNPSLHGQDGEEHVTSMANSLEVIGDVGMEKQGEDSEKVTGIAALAGIAIEELRGTSNLCPLVIEESESDSELPSSVDPCEAPEGSLLHTVHSVVLSGERLGDSSLSQLVVQQPRSSPASTSRLHGAPSSKTVLSTQQSTPATVQTGLSVDAHEGGGRTRRKAFQNAEKAIANAAMSEQATEFEKMLDSMGDMQMPSLVADRTDSQLISHGPLWTSSGKRKSLSSHNEELPYHGHPIPGGLQATMAEILASTDVQTGQSCVAVLNDTGNRRCKMMAMADDTLCEHHRSLQRHDDG